MSHLIEGLVQAFFETFFGATGRRLLVRFGCRRPDRIPSFFAGMAFWIIVGVLAYKVLPKLR